MWDLADGDDTFIYAVEYTGTPESVTWEEKELAIDKARRVAYEKTGNRKCMAQTNEGFSPYSGFSGTVIPVAKNTRPLKKWIGKKRQPLVEFEFGDEFEWEMTLEVIAERMDGREFWRIDGRNINWRGASGYKVVRACSAQELLDAIYKEDIVRVYCGKSGKHTFEVNAPTHDTPMGSYYHFSPISERTYYNLAE